MADVSLPVNLVLFSDICRAKRDVSTAEQNDLSAQ